MKMMEGWFSAATLNSMRTNFSASPCHLEVSVAAEMLKKVARASWARACRATPLIGPFKWLPCFRWGLYCWLYENLQEGSHSLCLLALQQQRVQGLLSCCCLAAVTPYDGLEITWAIHDNHSLQASSLFALYSMPQHASRKLRTNVR